MDEIAKIALRINGSKLGLSKEELEKIKPDPKLSALNMLGDVWRTLNRN